MINTKTQAHSQTFEKGWGGGLTFKNSLTQYTLRGYGDKDCQQKKNFKQMFANSTVLMPQKWQTPKFGVVKISRILVAQKGGGGGHFSNKNYKNPPIKLSKI